MLQSSMIYRKCIATIKAGADPLASLSGGPCERQCSAKLDRAYYRLRMAPEKLVCKPRPRGTGGSSLHLFGDYMRARNVAMDFAKSGCGGGRRRKVNKGFTKGDKVSDFYDPAKPAANIGQAQIDGLLEKCEKFYCQVPTLRKVPGEARPGF